MDLFETGQIHDLGLGERHQLWRLLARNAETAQVGHADAEGVPRHQATHCRHFLRRFHFLSNFMSTVALSVPRMMVSNTLGPALK